MKKTAIDSLTKIDAEIIIRMKDQIFVCER